MTSRLSIEIDVDRSQIVGKRFPGGIRNRSPAATVVLIPRTSVPYSRRPTDFIENSCQGFPAAETYTGFLEFGILASPSTVAKKPLRHRLPDEEYA